MEHQPVLAERVADLLLGARGARGPAVFVDATLGRAGHAEALLARGAGGDPIELVGIDRDPVALEASRARLAPYGARVRLVHDDFENLAAVLERLGVASVRGILLDLGVSSPQLDDPERGFGFRAEGPLDMRMDPGQTLSAAHVVNSYPEGDLARVIAFYGEERFAHRIARAIVSARPVTTTTQLAEVVKEAIPAAARRTGGHPARRAFQAIRMEVNRELDSLRRVLPDALAALAPGGRVAALSYHSLEDRTVKEFFAEESKGCTCPPDFPVCACDAQARLRVLTRRPVRPSEDEIASNPRARSAKLRVAERLAVSEGADRS